MINYPARSFVVSFRIPFNDICSYSVIHAVDTIEESAFKYISGLASCDLYTIKYRASVVCGNLFIEVKLSPKAVEN